MKYNAFMAQDVLNNGQVQGRNSNWIQIESKNKNERDTTKYFSSMTLY